MPCRGIGVDSDDVGTGIDIGSMNIPDQLGVGLEGDRAPGFVIHGCAKPFQFSANSTIEKDWIGAIDQSIEFHVLLMCSSFDSCQRFVPRTERSRA